MKSFRYYCLFLAALLSLAACDKADEKYKDFVPGGEKIYPGKAESLVVNPGKNRARLEWLLTTDPRIVKCRIYWNRKGDSVDIAVKRERDVDTIRTILNNLPEGPYLFEVYTFNAQGDQSIKTEVNGDVYGDFYESNLLNRILKKATISGGTTKLEWDEPDPRSPAVRLTYTDAQGMARTQLIPSSENLTTLATVPKTGSMSFQTLYLPVERAIDTFAAATVKVEL
ncbi:DUF4998 domain-containing protein [Chitinophaga lutea]